MSSVTEIKPPRHLVGLSDPGIRVHRVLSAASNNAAVIKAAPGVLFGVLLINSTSTVYYLKLYDQTSTPNPAADTPYMTIPIPHSSGAGGGVVCPSLPGVPFNTGMAMVLVAGQGDTDNTAAATGVAINLFYK